MVTNNKIRTLSTECMKEINGGMKWTKDRSCNVEDRRPGASTDWLHKMKCFFSSISTGDKWFDIQVYHFTPVYFNFAHLIIF